MSVLSIGDLATSMQFRRDTAHVKQSLVRLTSELSSGVVSNVVEKLDGDFGSLAGIEQSLVRMKGYGAVISEHKLLMVTQQSTISKLRSFGSISSTFLSLPDAADRTLISNAGHQALSNFKSALASLNVQAGGRTAFSGLSSKQPAMADAETVLTAIEAEIALAGAVTAAEVEATVVAWFAGGGGFETIGYVGGAQSTTDVRLSDNELAVPPINAETQPVREHLSALALGALLGRDVLSGDLDEQGILARSAGERLLTSDDQLIGLQASIGTVEAQIERATVEVASQKHALEIARADLIEVDPYETATKLQDAEARLQTVYLMTARLSRLSLTEYL